MIMDPAADRMRAMVPIRSTEGLEQAELLRLMQDCSVLMHLSVLVLMLMVMVKQITVLSMVI